MENDNQMKRIPVSNWTLATGTRPGERYVYSGERREGSLPPGGRRGWKCSSMRPRERLTKRRDSWSRRAAWVEQDAWIKGIATVQGDQPATGLRPRYPAHPPASTRRARPGHTRDPARRPVCEATADRRQLLCRFATIILAGPQRGRGCDSPAAGLRETGRTVFCSTLSSSAIEGDRLVGM